MTHFYLECYLGKREGVREEREKSFLTNLIEKPEIYYFQFYLKWIWYSTKLISAYNLKVYFSNFSTNKIALTGIQIFVKG